MDILREFHFTFWNLLKLKHYSAIGENMSKNNLENLKNNKRETSEIEYIVAHGVKKISQRREDSFYEWQKALDFFKEKEKENVYIDIFKKTTNILIEKIS